jgi:hypothetical protein
MVDSIVDCQGEGSMGEVALIEICKYDIESTWVELTIESYHC